jgi:hypothetical protein
LEELLPLDRVDRGAQRPIRRRRLGRLRDGVVVDGGEIQQGSRHDLGVDRVGHALHRVRQLTDVTAPRMREQCGARVR